MEYSASTVITQRGQQAFERALVSEHPLDALRAAAVEMLGAGRPRAVLLRDLEQLRDQLRRKHREADEDVVLDVMDFVSGWCSPHARL